MPKPGGAIQCRICGGKYLSIYPKGDENMDNRLCRSSICRVIHNVRMEEARKGIRPKGGYKKYDDPRREVDEKWRFGIN